MNLKLIVTIMIAISMGCASQPIKKRVNKRIIFKDLLYMPVVSAPAPVSTNNFETSHNSLIKSLESFPVKNIQFKNECDRVDKKVQRDLVSWINNEVTPDDMLIILGHSHGASSIGTDRLATKRVENVKKIVTNNNHKQNIFCLSSWGEEEKDFAPNKAVQIFLMKEFHKKQFSIVFSKGNEVQILNSLLKK